MKLWKKVTLAIVIVALVAAGIMLKNKNDADKKDTQAKTIASIDDLEGSRIGVQVGTTGDIYASEYDGDDAGTKVVQFDTGPDAVTALTQGKIDSVVIDEQPAKAFVEQNSSLSILDEPFANEDYAMCIAKDNTELKEQINDALAQLKENGTLQQIINYYIDNVSGDKVKYESPEGQTYGNGTITMATNAQFEPYEYYDGDAVTGIDVDMVQAVCDILGMKLKVADMDFDAIVNAVNSGKADIGVAGMTVTEDRLKNIDFTDAYTNSKQVIIVNNGTTATSSSLKDKLYDNFVKDGRWKYLAKGLGNTIVITIFAVLIGILLGFIVAVIRSTYDKSGSFEFLNAVCKLYLTIFRGTPIVVQLLIIYYVVFADINVNQVVVAIIAFGLNSGAYVAEIIRGGIMAVDNGQFEAGRSLGLNYRQTMIHIIFPQVFKSVLPALCNEFIALLKETSVCGYIGLMDLTRGGNIIRSRTYEALIPLVAVAIFYLAMVLILTAGVHTLERRLRKNER